MFSETNDFPNGVCSSQKIRCKLAKGKVLGWDILEVLLWFLMLPSTYSLWDLGFSVKPLQDFGLCFFGNVRVWGYLGFIFWCLSEEDFHTEREMVQSGLCPEKIQISHVAGSHPKLEAAKCLHLPHQSWATEQPGRCEVLRIARGHLVLQTSI